MSWDTVAPYNRGFREIAEAYDVLSFEDVHADALRFLTPVPGIVLDVGAGSGRDADWFAAHGWQVVAVEPATALREEATRRHPSALIRWIDDRLPALAGVHRLGLGFDLIWLSGVWMHIPPEDRPRAMRKIATLLRPGGRLMLTLRHGPAPPDRPMWPVDANESERLGVEHGLALRVATERQEDRDGRTDIRWQTVILDLPDDGGGALPLPQHSADVGVIDLLLHRDLPRGRDNVGFQPPPGLQTRSPDHDRFNLKPSWSSKSLKKSAIHAF